MIEAWKEEDGIFHFQGERKHLEERSEAAQERSNKLALRPTSFA